MKALAVSVEAALAGGDVLSRYYHSESDLQVSYKGILNLVTEADTESEQTIVRLLRSRFPEASILAEESGRSDGDSAARFVIDPLDGTTNFAHGYPMFAVSIAYEENGHVVCGVVFDPIREELFTASRGGGAFLNGRRLSVSKTKALQQALLVTGFPYDLRDDLEDSLRAFRAFMGVSRAVRRDGSAALDLCYLAAGRFDAFWEEKLGPWDTAAGALIVEEAGGRVTDFFGDAFHYTEKTIAASNGHLHPAMLEVLSTR
jgi:myo-inositol-1(or 4)-monophosphatase